MILQIVDFTGDGDGVTALYINGELHFHGDEYHDDILGKIKGFIQGLEFMNRFIGSQYEIQELETLEVTNEKLLEDVSCNAECPPLTINELLLIYK